MGRAGVYGKVKVFTVVVTYSLDCRLVNPFKIGTSIIFTYYELIKRLTYFFEDKSKIDLLLILLI